MDIHCCHIMTPVAKYTPHITLDIDNGLPEITIWFGSTEID